MRRSIILIGLAFLWVGCKNTPQQTPVNEPPPTTATATQTKQPSAPEVPKLTALEAKDILAKAVENSPNDPQPRIELARFYQRMGELAEAERQLLETKSRFPKYTRAHYLLGTLYLAQGRLSDAANALVQAVSTAPNDAQILTTAGQVLLQIGREPEAQSFAEKAVKLDPQLPDVYLLLARINDHHGTANQAIVYAKRYATLSANPAPGIYMVGRIYARQADSKNAEEWLVKARDAAPDNAEIWLTLGRVYFEMLRSTKGAEAVKCFQKVLEMSPKDWEANLWMGRTKVDEKNYADAVGYFRTAIANAPHQGPLYYDLSQALIKAGQNDEGQKMLAIYQQYREYQKELERITGEALKSPKDRSKRVELIRHCLKYKQYKAALAILKEAERTLGTDETFRSLQYEIATGLSSSGSPMVAPSGGAGNAR